MRLCASSAVSVVLLALLAAGCSAPGESGGADGFELPSSEASRYPTAYLARAVPAPEGDDLAEGAGEYVVLANNADIRIDMGGWWVEDADGNLLPLGIGRQIDVGTELRVYSSCGESTVEAVFSCAESEALGDDGDVLTLRDSAGGEVAAFAYGDAA